MNYFVAGLINQTPTYFLGFPKRKASIPSVYAGQQPLAPIEDPPALCEATFSPKVNPHGGGHMFTLYSHEVRTICVYLCESVADYYNHP